MPSTSSSTSSTPTTTAAHRASTRRGSISAPDPYGRHLELNMSPSRTTSSKLSIVRVLSLPPITLDPPPSSHRRQHQHQHQHQHHLHRRSTSSGSSSSHHHPQQQKPDSPRLSFASASFAAPGSPTLPPSPGGTSPRPSSPTHLRRASSVSITSSRTRLTPDQLIALAHEASSPRANPLTSPAAAQQQQHPTAPANFTELAPDVYLPFVNRAEEVSSLLASPGCARLLALLFQTFPPSASSDDDDKKTQDDQALLTSDSRKWTTAQLRFWLTAVDRPSAPDAVWVSKARACVLEHSELIWQRLKGALGVPPELDVDEEEEGGGEDVMASLPSALSFSSAGGSSGPGSSPPAPVEPEPRFTNAADDITDEDLLHPEEGEIEEDQHDLTSSLTFEPIFAGTSPAAPHDLPPTRPGAHSLADCVEEEDEDGAERECEPAPAVAQDVRGLVIRTVPSSPSIFAGMGFGVGPMSPGSTFSPFALGASATSPPAAGAVGGGGVSPAVSAIALPEPLSMSSSRARSASNASSRASHYSYRPASSLSMSSRRHSYASSDAGGGYYQAVGERGPGNPLFPSSFARLALGPTLSANNPALRSPASMPPANRFGPGLRGRLGMGAGAPSEYAVTLASESSVGA